MVSLSIIIPAFNVEKYIVSCLDSVINQTLKDIEIIVVNDCSSDGTFTIIKKYEQIDNRIRIIDLHENMGLGFARNIALRQAKGEYIMFVDSDDWLEIDATEKALEKIKSDNYDIVLFGHIKHYSGRDKEVFLPTIEENEKNFFIYLLLQGKGVHSMVWSYIYSRKFLLLNNIFCNEGIYFEDIETTAKTIYYAKSIGVMRFSAIYNYRIRANSITQKVAKKKIYDLHIAFTHLKNFMQQQNLFEKYENEYNIRFLTVCMVASFSDYIRLSKKNKDKELTEFIEDLRHGELLSVCNLDRLRRMNYQLSNNERILFSRVFNFLVMVKSDKSFKKLQRRIKMHWYWNHSTTKN